MSGDSGGHRYGGHIEVSKGSFLHQGDVIQGKVQNTYIITQHICFGPYHSGNNNHPQNKHQRDQPSTSIDATATNIELFQVSPPKIGTTQNYGLRLLPPFVSYLNLLKLIQYASLKSDTR